MCDITKEAQYIEGKYSAAIKQGGKKRQSIQHVEYAKQTYKGTTMGDTSSSKLLYSRRNCSQGGIKTHAVLCEL